MIQRIQSIWLLLASLTLVMLLVLPIITKTYEGRELWMLATGLYQKADKGTVKIDAYLSLAIGTVLIALIALANIFLFRNRQLQKQICNVVIILTVLLSVWIVVVAQQIPGGLNGYQLNIGTFMPLLSILFCFLAARGINNDERLIRSADRLR